MDHGPSARGSDPDGTPGVGAHGGAARPWSVVGVVCVGAFMAQLDASIAQLILPGLELEFHAPVGSVAWVSVAYLLVLAALLPVVGKLADELGRERLYRLGMGAFVLGSGLCGVAPTLPFLIGARAIQAVGGALLSANSVALIASSVGPERRGRALGIQSAAQAVGLCLGPAVGGLLLDTLGWRWVFWINVPVGLLGGLGALAFLPRSRPQPRRQPFDLPGALLLAPGLALLFLALHEGNRAGWTSAWLLGPAAGAGLLLTGFVAREHRAGDPLVDLKLVRNAAFASGAIAGMLSYVILFGVFLVLPFALIRAQADSSLRAGLQLAVIPAALALVAPLGGILSDRHGSRLPTVAGMVLVAVGLLLLGDTLDLHPDHRMLSLAALVLLGLGQGLFIAPNNNAILAVAGPERTGAAGGLINLLRALGMSLGISLGSLLLDSAGSRTPPGLPGSPHLTAPQVLDGTRTTCRVLAGVALVAAVLSAFRHRPMETVEDEVTRL